MIQAIVFDFGNVVGFFDHRLVTSRLLPYADLPADELHRRIFGGVLEDEYEKGHVTSAEFLRRLRAECGLRCPNEVIVESYTDIFWPNPEIGGLLPLLKPRYRLVLGSNTSELHSRHFRCQFAETLAYFDALVLSHEIGARKPAPAFFQQCVERAGCPAEECVFIDDLPANVAGAKAYGLHGIVHDAGGSLPKELAALGVLTEPTGR